MRDLELWVWASSSLIPARAKTLKDIHRVRVTVGFRGRVKVRVGLGSYVEGIRVRAA